MTCQAQHSASEQVGLMQITRQRVRPAMDVNVEETCPTCFGTGKVKSSILFYQSTGKKNRPTGQQDWHRGSRCMSILMLPHSSTRVFVSLRLKVAIQVPDRNQSRSFLRNWLSFSTNSTTRTTNSSTCRKNRRRSKENKNRCFQR